LENALSFTVTSASGTARLPFQVRSLWNGGWAGRSAESVRQHAAELASQGVEPPSTVPIFFPLSNNLATTTHAIQVLGSETSGEVEYALLFADDGATYVTVASDHSDRAAERYGIQLCKQLYPDLLAANAWPYAEVRAHWDHLVLRCWAVRGGERDLYQEAAVAELLHADAWIGTVEREGIRKPGLVFLSGTPPTLGGLGYAEAYELELEDPVLKRVIRHQYQVEVLGPGHQ
jgi:hypothetical protein